MLMVTGATGQLGTAVMAQLQARKAKDLAVLARDPAKAQQYVESGILVRRGDYDHPDALVQAFAGVSKLLLISSRSLDRSAQQQRVVDAAARAGVQHIVYTGLAVRDIGSSATRALMQSHFDTEDHIRNSGMVYTFLRNTMYADALPEIVGPFWRQQGIQLPGGTGAVPYALRRELGEATANVLLEEGHRMRTYMLTGTQSHGYAAVARALTVATGQPVPYLDVAEAEFEAQLQQLGLPEFMVAFTRDTVADIKARQYEVPSGDLAVLLGRPPADLEHMVREVFALSPRKG